MAKAILYFASNADTMIAVKTLKDAGVAAEMIPKPASIIAVTNLAVAVAAASEASAVAALAKAHVTLGGVIQ